MKKPELIQTMECKYAPEEWKRQSSNGCGTSGWKGWIVPDTLWGLNISEACNIHDWDYHYGQSMDDKEKADLNFLTNMLRLINAGWRIFRWLRTRRAYKYYKAVHYLGEKAFLANKQGINEFKLNQTDLKDEALAPFFNKVPMSVME